MLGFNSKKKITQEEFAEIKSALHNRLSPEEWHDVELLFSGDLHEAGDEKGISQDEYHRVMTWLKSHTTKHGLESDDIALLEAYFEKHLED